MGCSSSSAATANVAYDGGRGDGRGGGGGRGRVAEERWDAKFPSVTRTQLERMRSEFWETRVSGNQQMWQALKMASEAEDAGTALMIAQSAGLTPYRQDKPDVCYCYDERGFRYEVPMFVLHEPSNLRSEFGPQGSKAGRSGGDGGGGLNAKGRSKGSRRDSSDGRRNDDADGEDDGDDYQPGAAAAAAVDGDANEDDAKDAAARSKHKDRKSSKKRKQLSLTIRLSSGQDLAVKVDRSATVLQLKQAVLTQKQYPISVQRCVRAGRILPDDTKLSSLKLKSGAIVQMMVRRAS
eukprot:TRINITY_DN76267_c0_g1_i1.p1 TRINITY_DN76267_c0_g1~~TRINITY_DN76267_c0_g1_i1.p1  ORF type:complete len:294 (-),score=118.41 TRINITY_DN76267_c0_g1_i1:70-951(-)